MSKELFARLMDGLQQEVPVSIRVNRRKVSSLVLSPADIEPVPWCPSGYYLPFRPGFTFDPLFHAGVYYVQEASSMFLDHVVRHLFHHSSFNFHPTLALDLCAAPGGKSTCLRAALPDDCLLFSNEPVRQRAQILNENILKWGHPDVVVTNNYALDYRRSGLMFDLILADVPCSGEGMFRKDAQAIEEWSLQNVCHCQQLQREIVSDIWQALKPGGVLVYSTCTFNVHENEENVLWIARELGADFVDIPTDASWGIAGSLLDEPSLKGADGRKVCRFLPGMTRGEGLFMAVLRKKDADKDDFYGAKRPALEKTKRSLRVLSHGPLAPQKKGNDLIPDTSEALSYIYNKVYPQAEISYDQAISYLRKETVTLSSDVPRGIVALTFQGLPLGFAKNIGSRANNLYPQEWKIRSTHIPDYEAIFRPA